MTMIRGIALDLEGTIIDVEDAHHEGHLAAARDFGLQLSHEEALAQIPGFVGGGDEAVAEGLACLCGGKVPASQILRAIKHHYKRLLDTMAVLPRPGFLRRLDELESMGLRIVIGSLTPANEAQLLIERAGLTERFRTFHKIFRGDVTRVKPAPEVFLKTASKLCIAPSQQLVFEDSPPGVTAAVAAGSMAVAIPAVKHEAVLRALYQAGASVVAPEWSDSRLDRVLADIRRDALSSDDA